MTVTRTGLLLAFILMGTLALVACGTSSGLESAPDFQISLYQGEEALGATELTLSDLEGKPLLLNFWAVYCPGCIVEMPDLQEFYDEYSDRVNLFGLDVGAFVYGMGNRQDAMNLLAKMDIKYPTGSTPDEAVVREYEILGLPCTFFITADGKIFRQWCGTLNKSKLVEITEEMLAATG